MSVSEGLDPERVREIAGRLAAEGDRAESVRESGSAMLKLLGGVWSGDDVGQFAERWESAAPKVDAAARALREAARELERQADDQEETSGSPGGAPAAPPSPPKDDKPWWEDAWDGVKDFGEDLLDVGEDVVDTIGDGLDWIGDQVGNGLDWVGDRIGEGLDWLGDRVDDGIAWITEQASSIAAAFRSYAETLGHTFMRYTDAVGNHLGLFTQIFTEGRWPRISEVVASSLLVGGSILNLGGALLTGQDLNILDDGTGSIGEVTQLSTTESVDGHPTLRPPTSLDEILRSTTDAYTQDGNIRITTVTQPDGTVAYIVNTPGTETWNPLTSGNPLDLTGNLASMSGQQSAAMQAVNEAMQGIPEGAPVLMVGHSQGGIINNALLSDPAFTDRFNVTHSVTYGSPVDTFDVPPGVNQLNLQHATDVVPRLDLSNGPGSTTVTLPNPSGPVDVMGNHSHQNYADSVAASGNPDIQAYEASLSSFLAQDGAHVTGTDHEIVRSD